MPFFDLIIQWVESSDFEPVSDDLGHRILKYDFTPSDFAQSDCLSTPFFFLIEKFKSEARNQIARIANSLNTLLCSLLNLNFLDQLQAVTSAPLPPGGQEGNYKLSVPAFFQAPQPSMLM